MPRCLSAQSLPKAARPLTFLLVTGSAQPVRDADWINRHIRADEFAVLTDVSALWSALWSVLSLMGPRATELLARVSTDHAPLTSLKFSHTKEIDLSHARVPAVRSALPPRTAFHAPLNSGA